MTIRRIFVHDYGGHAFAIQLSRELARRGHVVRHAYSNALVAPRGVSGRRADDPAGFSICPIGADAAIQKTRYFRRYLRELQYGIWLAAAIGEFAPDVVLSANTPLEAQGRALAATRAAGARFILWWQDIMSVSFERMLKARLGVPGMLVARRFTHLERKLLAGSDRIVAISPDFLDTLDAWGVTRGKAEVIENWASTAELPVRPKANAWSIAHGLAEKFCFLYSGTLGVAHDPELLLRLAQRYASDPDVVVVVVSEGVRARALERRRIELRLERLLVLPFQPQELMADVMGSADVLVALLDERAATSSVPSKVMSYLCAGRPLLLAVPGGNLTARIVRTVDAGMQVSPGNVDGFLDCADQLRTSAQLRATLAGNGLRHACETFDIERIADRFEAAIASVA